ncbi:MAG: hypothetical protein IIY96_00665 [Lachnospiraceae bacterium]|nr:hypothetical protein [Lachnospiraceae bacterium]
MDREQRKYQNTLIVTGGGVIAFGIWSLVRFMTYFLLNTRAMMELLGLESREDVIFVYLVVFVMLLFDLAVRVFVGRAAIMEGTGRKKGNIYIAAAVVLLIWTAMSVYNDFLTFSRSYNDVLDGYAATLADVTSMFILAELLITAVRLKKMYREQDKAG